MVDNTTTPTMLSTLLSLPVAHKTRVTMRVRDSHATGYLVGMDDGDYLLAVTFDGDTFMNPPLLLIVHRRDAIVTVLHAEDGLDTEPQDIQEFVTEQRASFRALFNIPSPRAISE